MPIFNLGGLELRAVLCKFALFSQIALYYGCTLAICVLVAHGETKVSEDFQSAPVAPWLAEWGFVRHPFMAFEASQDEFLADHFVPHPGYFEQFTRNPVAAVLAPTGSGKTANRLMLVRRKFGSDSYLVTTRTGLPVAPLFSWPLLLDTLSQSVLRFAEKYPDQFLSLPEWRREALHRFVLDRLGGVALDEYIARWSQAAGGNSICQFVTTQEDALAPLVRLACDFARRQPRQLESVQPETIWQTVLGHLEAGGASHAAVLVDLENVMESPSVQSYLDKTFLHAMGDCFWLFAPVECAPVVKDSWAYQEGYLALATLDWPQARLIELLHQRLRVAGQDEPAQLLMDIAKRVSLAPAEELVKAALHFALGAPLSVLRLAQTVFDSRIQNFAQDGSLLLTEADWQPVRAALQEAGPIKVNPLPVSVTLVHSISSPVSKFATFSYDRTMLFDMLVRHFDEEELRTLCFKLEIDYDSLRGEGKRGKVRELILDMQRQERIPDLLEACAKERPEVAWGTVVLGG